VLLQRVLVESFDTWRHRSARFCHVLPRHTRL